jgi:hypothetical protein
MQAGFFKHDRVEAQARVIDSAIDKMLGDGTLMRVVYVMDVAPPAGAPPFRARAYADQANGIPLLEPGAEIAVRFNPEKPEEVEIVCKGDPRFDAKALRAQEQERIDRALAAPAGTPPEAPSTSGEPDPEMAKLDALLEDLQD